MKDSSALKRWMVAAPEVSHPVANYKAVSGAKDVKKVIITMNKQRLLKKHFFEKVKRLTLEMKEMGNPFTEESDDLLVLDTKDIAHSSAAELVAVHHKRGKEQFKSFMTDLQSSNDQCFFHKAIKKNVITFFKHKLAVSKTNSKMKEQEDDYQLFFPTIHLLPEQAV